MGCVDKGGTTDCINVSETQRCLFIGESCLLPHMTRTCLTWRDTSLCRQSALALSSSKISSEHLLCFTHTPRSQACGNLSLNSCFSWGPGKLGYLLIVLVKTYSEGGNCRCLESSVGSMSISSGDCIGLSPEMRNFTHSFQKASSYDT